MGDEVPGQPPGEHDHLGAVVAGPAGQRIVKFGEAGEADHVLGGPGVGEHDDGAAAFRVPHGGYPGGPGRTGRCKNSTRLPSGSRTNATSETPSGAVVGAREASAPAAT